MYMKMKTKMFSNNKLKVILNIVLALLFVISFDYYSFSNVAFGNQSIFNLLLFIVCYSFYKRTEKIDSRLKKVPYVFSFILSFSMVIGKVIYNYNDISPLLSLKNILISIISIISFTKFIGEICSVIFKKFNGINMETKTQWKIFKNKYIILLIWLVIFLCWIPTFLAYYPGITNYDTYSQTYQAFNGFSSYTKGHPPLHTFIWQVCIRLGQHIGREPIMIYSLIQMLFLSFVFAKMIKFIIDKKSNNSLIIFSILFVAINPAISIFSLSMTKDTYFGAFFILFILEICNLTSNTKDYLSKKINWFKFITFTLTMCLLRNNAIYVFILFIPIIFIFLKNYWKKMIPLLIIPLILYYLIYNRLYSYLNIKDGNIAEMFSVPIQQISYTANKNDKKLSNKLKSNIDKFISYDSAIKSYNPRFADPMKGKFKAEYYMSHKTDFYKLWLELFLKYPKEYVSSFLSLNIPYWYIDADTYDAYSKNTYIETFMKGNEYYYPVRNSKFSWLLDKLEKFASYEYMENVPFISNIFSLATPIWLIIFAIFISIYKKNRKNIIVLMPPILLWLTYIAGPVSIFRYIFPLFCLYPLFIYLIFNKEKYNKQK